MRRAEGCLITSCSVRARGDCRATSAPALIEESAAWPAAAMARLRRRWQKGREHGVRGGFRQPRLTLRYGAPSTNGRPAYPLVRYSALKRSDRFAFIGRLCPPPPKAPASLSPSLRGGVPFSQLICERVVGRPEARWMSVASDRGRLPLSACERLPSVELRLASLITAASPR